VLPEVWDVVAPSREDLDLLRPHTIEPLIRAVRPDWIINAAAYTLVAKAEEETGLAFALNSEAPYYLARAASKANAGLIHFSTDYVFDGLKETPYDEEDSTSPVNVYGRSKALGEELIRAVSTKHLVLRTSWVYGRRGSNFLTVMERLLSENGVVRVVNDQRGAPTSAADVAAATFHVIRHISSGTTASRVPWGTYHVTSSGDTTWYGFAQAISNEMPKCRIKGRLVAVSSEEYNDKVLRPLNSRLSNDRLDQTFKFKLPYWNDALRKMYLCGGEA
jgi:dTDP-4-dehydrorhamnose reductase